MIRRAFVAVAALAAAALVVPAVRAEDKEETLKGKVCCLKCELKMADKCHTVIKVDDKVYLFDDESHKKYHGDTCTEAKEGTVTGVVSKKDDKMYVKVTKLEYKKD